MLKIMRFFLLLIALPLIGCGGSGDGGGEKGVDASPTLNYTEKFEGPKALAFTGNTTEQPSFALRLDGILLLIYAYTDAVGENLKIEKIVYETEEDGINTLFFGGNNLPNGFVSKDKTIEIQRYSFTETNYFATIEIASDSGKSTQKVQLGEKFAQAIYQISSNAIVSPSFSIASETVPPGSLRDSFAKIFTVSALAVEGFSCALNIISCPDAIKTFDELQKNDGIVYERKDLSNTNSCLIDVENGKAGDPICIISEMLKEISRSFKYDKEFGNRFAENIDRVYYEGFKIDAGCDCPEDLVIEKHPDFDLASPAIGFLSIDQVKADDLTISGYSEGEIIEIEYSINQLDVAPLLLSGNLTKIDQLSNEWRTSINGMNFSPGDYIVELYVKSSNGGDVIKRYPFSIFPTKSDRSLSDNSGLKILQIPSRFILDTKYNAVATIVEEERIFDSWTGTFETQRSERLNYRSDLVFMFFGNDYISRFNPSFNESYGYEKFPQYLTICKNDNKWVEKEVEVSWSGSDSGINWEIKSSINISPEGIFTQIIESESTTTDYNSTGSLERNLNIEQMSYKNYYISVTERNVAPNDVGTLYFRYSYPGNSSVNADDRSKLQSYLKFTSNDAPPSYCF